MAGPTRQCNHKDVGDCDPNKCFGVFAHLVNCSTCGEPFDLNHEGRYEHDGALTHLACSDCPLPSEYVLPRIGPKLLRILLVEEGVR